MTYRLNKGSKPQLLKNKAPVYIRACARVPLFIYIASRPGWLLVESESDNYEEVFDDRNEESVDLLN